MVDNFRSPGEGESTYRRGEGGGGGEVDKCPVLIRPRWLSALCVLLGTRPAECALAGFRISDGADPLQVAEQNAQ